MKNKLAKCLIQRADRLGDVIFSLPVIEQLNETYPNLEIHMLTSSIGSKICHNHPKIAKVYQINVDHSLFSKASRQVIRKLKQEKYDLYISLWNHPRMALLGCLARIPF